MENNQQAYSDHQIVKKYIANLRLEKAEQYIFDKYSKYIDHGNILDVGIGGGRTTYHLIKRAKEYTGIDFSEEFVKHAQKTYATSISVKIEWADARDLSKYPKSYFDFILFSFNGIDYVSITDREKILSEFHRALTPDGIVCFSFHNSRNIDKLYSYQMPKNPLKYLGEWQRCKQIKEINGPKEKYQNQEHFTIYDGGENFTAHTLYIKPEFQKKELEQIGFEVIEFRETMTNKRLSDDDFAHSEAPWIYVIAQKK